MKPSIGNRALTAAEDWSYHYAGVHKLSPVIQDRLIRAFMEGVSWHQQEEIRRLNGRKKKKA